MFDKIPDVLMNAPIGFFRATPEGRLLAVNQTMARMLGYETASELLVSITDISRQIYVDSADRLKFLSILEANEKLVDYETRILHRDGSTCWVSKNVEAIRDENGKMLYFQGFSIDISERKKAEKSLQEKKLLLEQISENMFDLVSLTDLELNYKFLGGSRNILGYDPKTLMGRNALEFIHPDDLSGIPSALESFIANRESKQTIELRYRRADGGYTWLETVGSLFLDESGNPKEIVLSSRDITERRRAEEKAKSDRERYCTAIIETTRDSFILLDHKGAVIEANDACCRLSGYTRDELLRLHISDLNYDSMNVDIAESIKLIQSEGSALFEFRYIKKDGGLIDVEASTTWLDVGDGKIICFFRDITERRQAEKALRHSEKEKSLILNASSDIFCYYDLDLRFLWVNKAAGDAVNQPPDALYGRYCYEIWHGRSLPCEECPALLSKETKKPQQKEIQTPDGRIWLLRSYPIQDENDSVVALVAFGKDITESKRLEESLRHLNATLEQRVGERTEIAEARTKQLQSLAMELVQAEESERHRIADLLHDDLQQLIASARMQLQSTFDKADSGPILRNVERLLAESLEKSRHLSQELSPPVLHQFGLVTSLEWMVRHMDEQFGLRIWLETEMNHEIKDAPLKVFLFRAAQELLFNAMKHSGVNRAHVRLCDMDNRITLFVSDKGHGFDPGILDSFNKESGFGLVSLRERAAAIGGSLEIVSQPGQGSSFNLTVPISLGDAGREKKACVHVSSSEKPDNNETIPDSDTIRVLFVDDHKVMRQGLVSMISGQPNIEAAGEAASGEEALELAGRLRPDVIIMDISMPGMGGMEATRRIKAEMPGIKVIGLSMFTDENICRKMRDAGADGFVSKSQSSAELLKAIYKVARPDATK